MNQWKRVSRRIKEEYRNRILEAWISHGLRAREEREIKGLRALIHAIYETPIGYTTLPREDLEAIASATKIDGDFARTLHRIAAKYGEKIPLSKSPEAYVGLIAEQPRWAVSISDTVKRRRTGSKLADLKLEMMKDVEELTKRAYRIAGKG